VGKRAAADRVSEGVRTLIVLTVLYNDQVATAVGMSASEMQVQHLLTLRGPLTPGELAKATGLSTGTVTGVVDRLETLGLAHRSAHASDRRKVVVTADEQAIWERFGPYYRKKGENLEHAIAQFTPAQLAVVADFIDALIEPELEPRRGA
jgi:DNA-binding MarR family transcriptional regulator